MVRPQQMGLSIFNRRWWNYASLAADQVQNWGWTAAVHPDGSERTRDDGAPAIASSQSVKSSALASFRRGYRWFLFRATPSFDDKGKVAKW